MEGSGTETVTDAEGRFELDHLGAGTYQLHFTHPYLKQLWYEPEPIEVEVEPYTTSLEVGFEAPSMSDILADVCGQDRPPGAPLVTQDGRTVWRTGILTGRVTDEDGSPVKDATLHFLMKAYEVRLYAEVRDPSSFDFEAQRLRWSAKTSSSGFYRMCWLPSNLPIELVVLGKDEDVDRDALKAALSFADLFPDRVTTMTIDPTSPHSTVDLRVEARGRKP